MGLPVLVIGPSGAGKTYGLKNFSPEEIGVIGVEKTRLPFRSKIKVVSLPESFGDDNASPAKINLARYSWILNVIQKSKAKSIAIDDSQYLLANELFDRCNEVGYTKFNNMASNFRNLIHFVNKQAADDKIVYFLHHSEDDAEGRKKAKTVGKMLDEKLVIEGCFNVVLYCVDHKFYTQANGTSTAKTPEDMFSSIEIQNDLKAVDVAIREYYGMSIEGGA